MALHIADGSDDNIRVIPDDTADGGTADASRTYTTTDSTDVQSIVYDGTHIHVTNWQQSTVRVYATNLSGVSPVVRSYTVTGISQPSGMAFDGTHLHISDRASDNIRVIAPDTADGGTATILRTYEVTGLEDCRGMAFDGENIHAADYTDDNIRVFAPDTPNNGTATVLRTYTVPGVNHSRSIAFDGVNIHVSDVTDDNFRVVAVPTAGGAQTVLRTYEVTGIDNPRGMTSVDDAKITPTISFANSDLIPNQQTLATITFPEAVTGMERSDLSLDVGTLGASLIAVSTTVYRIPVTAPSSGSGRMTLTLAEDAVTPPNTAVSASIDYAEPPVATMLEIVSGDNQSATVSTALANDLVVRVLDQNNNAFSGSTVTFTTTGGTLSETSVVTGADGQASTSLTLPAIEGDYTVTASVSGLTDVSFTATAIISSIVIAAIGEQFITIDTDYSLDISITGDPMEVTVDGLLEGFHYSWDADTDILTVAGEATRLLSEATWTVSAKETATSTAVTSEITYHVIPAVPIIEEIGETKIFTGALTKFFIEVQNKPTKVNADGLLMGMKSEPSRRTRIVMEEEVDVDGIEISGRLPEDVNLTVDATTFAITASNDGGTDSYDLPIDIEPAASAYLMNRHGLFLYKISPAGELTWTYTTTSGTASSFTIDSEGNIYLRHEASLYKISAEDGTVAWTYTLPSGTYGDCELASDGGILVEQSGPTKQIRKVNSTGADLVWSANFGVVATRWRIVVPSSDGGVFVYRMQGATRQIRRVSSTGTTLWTHSAGSAFDVDLMAVDAEDNLYYITNSVLRKFSAGTGLSAWTFSLPGRTSFQRPVILANGDILAGGSGSSGGLDRISSEGVSVWNYDSTSSIFTDDAVAPVEASDGAVYAAMLGGNPVVATLRKISSGGLLVWSYTLESTDLAGLLKDSEDNVLISLGNGKVFKISEDGSLLWEYTPPSSTNNDVPVIGFDDSLFLFNEATDDLRKISISGSEEWVYDAPTASDYENVITQVLEEG